MKRIVIIVFLLGFIKLKAQIKFTPDSTLSSAIKNLPDNKIYIVSQLHNNEANTIIEKECLLSLNERFKVHYDVLEFAHSVAFLLNFYLNTGEDSLLNFINRKANFSFIKSIKNFNDHVDSSKKIKFFGVDFEGRNNGSFTKKAIQIISDKIKLPVNHPLQILLNAVIEPSIELGNSLTTLKTYLNANKVNCKLLLGKYYIDVLLISNAQTDFAPKRDDVMFNNFILLYNELAKTEQNPKFFMSFGIGHVNLMNKKEFAYRLLKSNDSPVKNDVCLIGTEYYNCLFCNDKTSKPADGILNYLCKQSTIQFLNSSSYNKEKSIIFFGKDELNSLTCSKAMDEFSGLIIVKNFGATTHWTWE